MSTFLFFNVPSTGHVDPTLPLAAELVHRGHMVAYFLTEAYRERVEATGAAYRGYTGIGPDYFDAVTRRFNPVRLATQLAESVIALAPSLMEAVDDLRPDVIVYDSMCPWGRVVAHQASLPAVASMALLEVPPRYVWQSGEVRAATTVITRGLSWIPRYWRAARAVRQLTGASVPPFIRLLNWPGDHNICYTARLLQPDAHRFGVDYTFVGPPLVDGQGDIPFPFELLAPDRPLVYVSLGTVFNNDPEFFRTCLAALARRNVQVVVSTGRGLPAAALGQLPGNAIVRDYVPQQAILQRASLFISHSGANSVHHALYHGVPLLLVPQQLEQALIAARVTELGAGLLLNRRKLTEQRIGQLTQRLLEEDSFRSQAATLGDALRGAGGAVRAADLLEKVR